MSESSEKALHLDDAKLDYESERGKVIEAARADSIRANDSLRRMMTEEILPLFKVINKYVLLFVGLAMLIDTALISIGSIEAEQRLINSEVIMALIGAATVQVGSIVFTISAYLFPKSRFKS
ncbi:MAG: hypothetical protein ACRESZ_17785 [Methylococcales bacterium]